MYYLVDDREIVKNIIILGKSSGVNETNYSSCLCRCYRNYLGRLLPDMEIPLDGINVILERDKTNSVIKKYEGPDTEGYFITDAVPFEIEAITEQKNMLNKAIIELDDSWHGSWLIHTLFHTIFFAHSKTMAGGSTSNAIGVLWLNIPQSFTVSDLTEFFVHETAHQLTFIDEIIYGNHYDYKKIKNNDLYTRSAILNMFRPADKVFHSVIVAHTIVSYRKKIIGNNFGVNIHGRTNELLNNAISSSEMLLNVDNKHKILTDRGRYLIMKCHKSLVSSMH